MDPLGDSDAGTSESLVFSCLGFDPVLDLVNGWKINVAGYLLRTTRAIWGESLERQPIGSFIEYNVRTHSNRFR